MLEDISSSDLPSFITSDVAEDLILFPKHLFDQKKKENILTIIAIVKFHENIHYIQLL